MTSQCVTELEGHLRDMLSLKPPGVTGGKISKITELCNTNIQSESVLIQRIYTHFKKTPPTHKLGVLYVVDSVTRGWVEQAKKAGQTLGQGSPPPGTYAAGVGLVTELLPSFMNDMINNAPEEQKARISKLVDIWDRGSTFPSTMLSSFREKLTAPPQNARSTTPTGSPPKDFIPLNGAAPSTSAAATPDTSKILQALADMAKSNTTATGDLPAPTSSGNFNSLQNAFTQNLPSSINAAPSVPPLGQSVSMPGGANIAANAFGGLSSLPNFAQPGVPNGQQGSMQQANPLAPTGPSPELLQQQVQVIQMLQASGVPQEQWAAVLSVMMSTGVVGGGANNAAAAQPSYAQNPTQNQNQGYGTNDPSRDRSGYNYHYNERSPSARNRNRSRSPSPGPGYRRDGSPPRRRDSPTYGAYGRNGRDRDGRGGGISSGGRDYRQRSPNRSRRSDSPRRDPQALPPPGPRNIDYDRTLPPGHIKVLSRTLFVGGVTSSEDHLRGIFAQFGLVQTCIVNVDKRHAFVKMLTRQDSVRAKDGMERYKSAEMQLRTRWGVGFGPRDCSDYQTGISIIPMERLTDADRKWMLTADYGGTGGIPMEQGMVVEEPDIEIGAGVSSKAISRRMQTDKGGQQGPRSERAENQRYRQPERSNNEKGNSSSTNQNSNNNAAVPNFTFPFPGMPGFPAMPPGFVFPGTTPAQPPPPGAS